MGLLCPEAVKTPFDVAETKAASRLQGFGVLGLGCSWWFNVPIGVILGVHWRYIGIMEKKMETTILGFGVRVWGFRVLGFRAWGFAVRVGN